MLNTDKVVSAVVARNEMTIDKGIADLNCEITHQEGEALRIYVWTPSMEMIGPYTVSIKDVILD